MTVVSATSITADSPAGTGTVDVIVTAPGGTSAISSADQFSYIAAPTVSSVVLPYGPVSATSCDDHRDRFHRRHGGRFRHDAGLELHRRQRHVDQGRTPAGTDTVDVTVTTLGGTSATSSADFFTYAPTVYGVSPSHGPTAGGTLVTITGTGFTGVTAVNFGATPATGFTVVNNSTIKAFSPPGTTGTVDVTVTSPSGTSATSSADEFIYGPAVSGISPAAGPLGGGTLVTITGVGFTGATAVRFGSNLGTIVDVVSDTTITANSPPGTGTVDVTVTTPDGKSPTLLADQFMYLAAPTVSAIGPPSGPTAGGTFVTIEGTNFTDATEVDFGTTPATNVTVISATEMTANSPAGTGTVDVTVTTPGGTSATSSADRFSYIAAPDRDGRDPAYRSGGRQHRCRDHGDWFHRRHGGRLWDDPGDELYRPQRHDDLGPRSGGHRHGRCDCDGAGGDVGHLARG